MAIKTVSHLDKFDNHGTYGIFTLGNNADGSDNTPQLALFTGAALTNDDKQNIRANTRSNNLIVAGDKYWGSLFEISKTREQLTSNNNLEYDSYSITYQQLIENIIWDVKSYLNHRNNLNDYDLLSVIERDYTFTGNKTFNGTVIIKGNTTLGDNSARDDVTINADLINLGTLTQNGTSYFNNDAHFSNYVKTQQLSVYTSAVTHCNIIGESRDIVFDGWSFGLVDRTTNTTDTTADKTILSGGAIQFSPTYVGTYGTTNSSIDISLIGRTSLSGESNRTGDPVCFVRGRPWELTAVNFAMSAYNLVDRETGGAWNVGNGIVQNIGSQSDVNESDPTAMYKAVYFKDGKPEATNTIDFANHAKWSDLGERYLADDVYEPGTLVKFGGEKEITIADTEVNAIVSTKAFDLNAGLEGGTVIALCGRVPTKVKGKIEKFDKIMLSDIPGVACKWDGVSRVIGRALESNLDENIKLVECLTRFEI